MPIVEYPFTYPNIISKAWPRLPIEVFCAKSGSREKDWALIDTGAMNIFLPAEYVKTMNIQMTDENEIEIFTAGRKRKGHRYKVHINIYRILEMGDDDHVYVPENIVVHLNNVAVDFVPSLKYPILGVRGFLEQYVFTINYKREQFSIRTPSKERACKVCWPRDNKSKG